ncbi:Gfo/Idh/MocA family oxidoreductase [Paenibacillus antri]|uniref:Gfo/Idh/MocA family oxidoreductase n=1 Tax=Paenibacillus antri TaxID=2582848 RepID=A0A5R9G5E7_9BACL|nr:Gfo/Idh/MocA family oxidoreductase [Paenibacillus antri]TLS50269.1 Gfo/Idh/MocA family oxidoreductase [Paenibacillus antri]
MSNGKIVKIGVIGAGNIGNEHIKQFSAMKDQCEVVAVTDAYLPLAEQRAKEYGIPNVYDNAEALLESDVDAVVVGVPNKFHAPVATLALEKGKHVLLEKPMGIDLDSAKAIVRKQRETGKIVMIAHQMRWEWLATKVKEQVDRGELGSVYTAKAGWYRRKGIPGWGTWFTRMSESGGGPLIDIGVHMLDLSLHLMGSPKPVAVSGATYAEFGPRKKGIGTWGKPNWEGYYDVEDLATAFIRMEDGRTLTLEVSWAVHMDTNSTPFVHLMGTDGGAALYGNRGKFLTERFDAPMEVELSRPEQDEGARKRMSDHFLACVRDGKEPITSVMTGYTNNLILDAIYRSSRSGKEITLDWSL